MVDMNNKRHLTEQDILRDNLLKTGQARSNPAPPIYPFTIPPEGQQENQGYHGYQGSENNNDAIKVLSHCYLYKPFFSVPGSIFNWETILKQQKSISVRL